MPDRSDIEFFFDPICPFAWITSRWITDVAPRRGATVAWRFISLAVVNEGKDYATDFPPAYPVLHGLGRDLLRVAAAARESGGNDAVAALYAAAGARVHIAGVNVALSRTGPDVGTPILTFDPGSVTETSLFGPVISKAPKGDEALELFDAVV